MTSRLAGCIALGGAVALLIAVAACSAVSTGAPVVTPAMSHASGASADKLTAGRRVFVSRCIECHTLPAINEHTPAAWPHIIARMSPRADLTAAERDALLSYILAARQP